MDNWASDFSNQLPIYIQIVQQFKARVASGALSDGERLPSIRDLAIVLRVNPNTVMRAYQELEREGLIKSQRGLGFFVASEGVMEAILQEMARSAVERYVSDMRHIGLSDDEICKYLQDYIEREKITHGQID